MKTSIFIILVCISIALNAQNYAQKNDRFKGPWSTDYDDFGVTNNYLKRINLDEHSDNNILKEKVLSFIRSDQVRDIWGVGNRIDAVFDEEYLPVFFERELVLNEFNLDTGLLKWVFTGNEGGYTIQISNDSIHLYQRYYNSFGFNKIIKDTLCKNYRHPNEIWLVSATKIEGKLKTVKLKTDYTYHIYLEVNGTEIARQVTKIDVFRDQLQFTVGIKEVKGSIYKPKAKTVSIELDDSEKHQTILGFGGIMSIPTYNELSDKGKTLWWNLMKEYNLHIQREYPIGQMLNESLDNWDNIADASPHYYGDNFPNGEVSDFEFNKRIIDSGGMVVFSFWKLPQFMFHEDGQVNTEKYTNTIINYCETSKQKSGALPAYIGIQNEISKPKTEWQQMTLALRKALDENNMQEVKIMMFNSPYVKGAISAAKAFKEDPDVWENIDYAASNMYDYNEILKKPHTFDSRLYELKEIIGDKPFISSELAINWNDYQAHTYRTAFSMAILYHKNMTILDAVSLQYCWTLMNSPQEAFNMTRTLLTVDEKNGFVPFEQGYMLRTYGAFSRHLPKCSVRIGSRSNNDDILVSAYETAKGKVMVLLNQGTAAYEVKGIAGYNKMEIASWCFVNDNKLTPKQLFIQPGEIITLLE